MLNTSATEDRTETKIRLDRDDLTLEEIPTEECSNCCAAPATHYLQIDLRAIGWTAAIGEFTRAGYCEACGNQELEAIRATMPERLNEDGVEP